MGKGMLFVNTDEEAYLKTQSPYNAPVALGNTPLNLSSNMESGSPTGAFPLLSYTDDSVRHPMYAHLNSPPFVRPIRKHNITGPTM